MSGPLSSGQKSLSHEVELYVAPDKLVSSRLCLGSLLCTNLLQYLPENMVKVVNARTSLPPSFCTGTPCLYEVRTKTVYVGFDAYEYLLSLVVTLARRGNTSNKPRANGNSVTAKKATMREHSQPVSSQNIARSAPMMQPHIQLNEKPSRIQQSKADDEEETEDMNDFWQANSSSKFEEEASEVSGNKLSEDDFQRIMNTRTQAIQPTQGVNSNGGAPALKPLDD